jgi:hypothetical protein
VARGVVSGIVASIAHTRRRRNSPATAPSNATKLPPRDSTSMSNCLHGYQERMCQHPPVWRGTQPTRDGVVDVHANKHARKLRTLLSGPPSIPTHRRTSSPPLTPYKGMIYNQRRQKTPGGRDTARVECRKTKVVDKPQTQRNEARWCHPQSRNMSAGRGNTVHIG